tara:strand:- start:34 stop:600 length:567 start_codon:yes stop_codon:yes gene_type:complete
MRIIGGSFKGKKLIQPYDFKTRPLKDLTKESIFNILIHTKKFNINLNSSVVLDIFSGVGSFGIECISRGVKSVIFIENYRNVLTVLKKNLKNLKSISNYEIIENDVYDEKLYTNLNNKFDIIFLDPPYKDKNFVSILSKIKDQNLLTLNGVIIIHRHKNEKDNLPSKFRIVEEKKYGISKILFVTYLS